MMYRLVQDTGKNMVRCRTGYKDFDRERGDHFLGVKHDEGQLKINIRYTSRRIKYFEERLKSNRMLFEYSEVRLSQPKLTEINRDATFSS